MAKATAKFKKPTAFFCAFLALALVFLALGLGTLGSFDTVGRDYELGRTEKASDYSAGPSVVFLLPSSSTVQDEEGNSVTVRLSDVLINVGAVYTTEATATIEMIRASSADSFYSYNKLGGGELNAVSSDMGDAFSWVSPFTVDEEGLTLGTYRYYRLRALDCNVRINEVVFVGSVMDGSEMTDRHVVIPVSVHSATPVMDENADTAREAASVLVDAQKLPPEAQSSFCRYTEEEKAVLLSLAEMRAGSRYLTDGNGALLNGQGTYHGDTVYGALGLDLLALGTAMFGVCPFGLRFFPMLFSFGILAVGYFFVKRLTKSEAGAFAFAALYALCGPGLSLGHLGTPLTAGLFFFVCALALVYRFYSAGMNRSNIAGAAPLLLGGLCAAAAVCVNGAFVLPVAGVCALYALGVVRLRKARRFFLDEAIGKAEVSPEEGQAEAGKVEAEYRHKTVSALVSFPVAFLFGTLLFSLVCMLPAYYVFLKLYDNPAAPVLNVFGLSWLSFAGGFTGSAAGAPSAWNWFYKMFEGSGTMYAVTGAVMNPAAMLIGLFGLAFACVRIGLCVRSAVKKEFSGAERTVLRRTAVPLAGLVLSLIAASFAGGALAFVFLAYVFSFVLAAEGAAHFFTAQSKRALIVYWVAFGVLAALFALFAVFTFSVPLPAELLAGIFG